MNRCIGPNGRITEVVGMEDNIATFFMNSEEHTIKHKKDEAGIGSIMKIILLNDPKMNDERERVLMIRDSLIKQSLCN